jgi:hypothetical protein
MRALSQQSLDFVGSKGGPDHPPIALHAVTPRCIILLLASNAADLPDSHTTKVDP